MPNPNPNPNPNLNPSYAGPSLWRTFAMAALRCGGPVPLVLTLSVYCVYCFRPFTVHTINFSDRELNDEDASYHKMHSYRSAQILLYSPSL